MGLFGKAVPKTAGKVVWCLVYETGKIDDLFLLHLVKWLVNIVNSLDVFLCRKFPSFVHR